MLSCSGGGQPCSTASPANQSAAALQHCYWAERVAVIPDVKVGDGDAGGRVNRQRRRQSLLQGDHGVSTAAHFPVAAH